MKKDNTEKESIIQYKAYIQINNYRIKYFVLTSSFILSSPNTDKVNVHIIPTANSSKKIPDSWSGKKNLFRTEGRIWPNYICFYDETYMNLLRPFAARNSYNIY